LTTRSLLRKRFSKLMANSKGFSSVIGTTFMVLVMMFLGTSVFLWTLSQNTLYNEAVKEKNQLEVDRLNEKVTASGVNYTIVGDVVSVEVVLENKGPISVEVVSLWVIDATINRHNSSSPLNINLKPGNTTYLQGSKAINVTIVGSASSHQFSSWFVTARGNVVSLEREGGVIESQITQGIGSVSMNFASFIYFNVTKVGPSFILENYPDGGEGFTVPSGKDIAFQVCLTNLDPQKKEIKLFSRSLLWMLFPTGTSDVPHSAWWYIVNVDDDAVIADDFTQIVLPYGAPKSFFFASSQDVDDGGFNPSNSKRRGPAAVNLMLIGQIGTSAFGQNIPFVSVYVT